MSDEERKAYSRGYNTGRKRADEEAEAYDRYVDNLRRRGNRADDALLYVLATTALDERVRYEVEGAVCCHHGIKREELPFTLDWFKREKGIS